MVNQDKILFFSCFPSGLCLFSFPESFDMNKTLLITGVVAAAAIAASIATFAISGSRPSPNSPPPPAVQAELFPTHENAGPQTPRVATGTFDPRGNPVSVSCSSCHSTREPNREIRAAEQLAEFHQGLRFAHGGLSCLSCHNADNYETLRLADGAAVEYSNARMLCTQCHTRQGQDFERGLHGGMKGFWDLTRGPRQRNSCLDCHDAHHPAFPEVLPVFPPRDRFQPVEH
jgi:hypothetical protein